MLDGVRKHVRERLGQERSVGARREIGRAVELHDDAASGRHLGDEPGEERLQPHEAEHEAGIPTLRPGEGEHRLRKPHEPVRLELDVAEEAVAGIRQLLCAGLQHLDRGRDGRDRRAQLVSSVDDELAVCLLAAAAVAQVLDRAGHAAAGHGRRGDLHRRRAHDLAHAGAALARAPRHRVEPLGRALARGQAQQLPRAGVDEPEAAVFPDDDRCDGEDVEGAFQPLHR